MRLRHHFAALLCAMFITVPGQAVAELPRVVVSVAPVHALVAGVMAGVGTPELLIPLGASPHAFALRPSQRRAIESADILVWVGPTLEPFLRKPIADMADKVSVVKLIGYPGITLAPAREAGIFSASVHAIRSKETDGGHGHGHGHGGEHAGGTEHGDPHIWLDPDNAIAIVNIVKEQLVRLSPSHAVRYNSNAQQLIAQIGRLDVQIKRLLADVRDGRYVVFHDAYQGFERHYDLHPVAAISLSPAIMPGTRRVLAIRRALQERRVRCVFSEPQFEPRLIDALIEGLPVRQGVLDPLGGKATAGENGWLSMMLGIATSLHGCLSEP